MSSFHYVLRLYPDVFSNALHQHEPAGIIVRKGCHTVGGDSTTLKALIQTGRNIGLDLVNAVPPCSDHNFFRMVSLLPAIEAVHTLSEEERLLAYALVGTSPLHQAGFHGQVDCIEMLLTMNADPSSSTNNPHGQTPLHLAAMGGNENAVVTMLQAGAKLTLTDSRGRSATDLARKYGHVKLFTQMRSWEKDVSSRPVVIEYGTSTTTITGGAGADVVRTSCVSGAQSTSPAGRQRFMEDLTTGLAGVQHGECASPTPEIEITYSHVSPLPHAVMQGAKKLDRAEDRAEEDAIRARAAAAVKIKRG